MKLRLEMGENVIWQISFSGEWGDKCMLEGGLISEKASLKM